MHTNTSPTDSRTSRNSDRRTLWLVNQYALADHEAGITRHAKLARSIKNQGWDTVIFASASHYWNLSGKKSMSAKVERLPEATFVRIKTATHVTNGVRRMISMVVFSLRVLVRCTRRKSEGIPRPDVVLGSSPHPFGAIAAYLLARAYHVPFVLEVRDLWPDSLIELLDLRETNPAIRALRAIEVFLYKRASAIIGVLPGVEDHVRSLVPDAAPVHWVPNGVDLSVLPDVQSPTQHEDFTVLYAGAHGVPNSLEILLEAAKLVQLHEERLPRPTRTTFVLIGDGKEKVNLIATAARLELANVKFRDAVPSTEVPGILASADVLVTLWLDRPLYRYGVSPNKLFDYFAAGRPVVLALSSPYDDVSTACAGITVPPEDPRALADAVLELRRIGRDERIRLGLNGRRFVEEQHDMAELGNRYASVFNSVSPATELTGPPRRSRND
jgi:glycosyltransferase involved in cell wall biosynthesis